MKTPKLHVFAWNLEPWTGLAGLILKSMTTSPRALHGDSTRLISKSGLKLALVFGLLATASAFAPPTRLLAEPLAGQARGTAQRVVHGKVEDKDGASIKGAVVYLKDGRTNSVKSAIADDQGGFRFVQLSLNTDYEIWAQSDEHKSGTKAISSFDSKVDITVTLKIDK